VLRDVLLRVPVRVLRLDLGVEPHAETRWRGAAPDDIGSTVVAGMIAGGGVATHHDHHLAAGVAARPAAAIRDGEGIHGAVRGVRVRWVAAHPHLPLHVDSPGRETLLSAGKGLLEEVALLRAGASP